MFGDYGDIRKHGPDSAGGFYAIQGQHVDIHDDQIGMHIPRDHVDETWDGRRR